MASSDLIRLLLLSSLIGLFFAATRTKNYTFGDDGSPNPPCNNPYLMVKVKNWVNGEQGGVLEGVGAKFGALLPSQVDKAIKLPVVISNPFNGCNKSSSQELLHCPCVVNVTSLLRHKLHRPEGLRLCW